MLETNTGKCRIPRNLLRNWKNFTRDEKITDLSSLPPFKSSLLLYIKRPNFVARTWRQAAHPMIVQDNPMMHGWKDEFLYRGYL